jgi:16S rRNA (guanine966-N2)-methyltransferase
VREALFSVLGDVSGLRVLDLFAGSGALAIEALSRGAASAVLVDCAGSAVACASANLSSLGLSAAVHRRDFVAFLRGAGDEVYDLVFVDPPYERAAFVGERLDELLPRVLAPGARVVVESARRAPLSLALPLTFERAYGDTLIRLFSGPL